MAAMVDDKLREQGEQQRSAIKLFIDCLPHARSNRGLVVEREREFRK